MNKLTSQHILIVEDNPVDANLLQKHLKQLGVTETTVVSGSQDAWEVLKDHRFDLVLMDIVLDKEDDGIEAARVMQQDLGLPVVFITGYSDEETINRAKQVCPYGYLLKPITRTGLSTTLEMALQRALMDAELLKTNRELETANQALTHEVNERRKAEAAARESENRWRTMTDTAPDAIFLMDGEGTLLYVNAVIAGNFKCAPEDLIGRKESDLLPPEITEPHIEWVNRVLKDKVPFHVEDHVTLPAGEMWFDTRLVPLQIGNLHPYAVLGVSRDITSRKLKERELHDALSDLEANKVKLTGLLKATNSLLRHEDFQEIARSIFLECKKTIGATAGYIAMLSADGRNNEVIFLDSGGESCTADPDLPMPIIGLQAMAYNTGLPVYENHFNDSEWIRLLPEGHVTLDNVMFVPLLLDDQVQGVVGLTNKPGGFSETDFQKVAGFVELAVVALKKTMVQNALGVSEKRFRKAFEMAGTGMALIDVEGRIKKTNTTLTGILGYTEQELLFRNISEFSHDDDVESWRDTFRRVLNEDMQKGQVECRFRDREDREVWCLITLSLMTGSTNTPQYLIVQFQDISQRREAQERLLELAATLEEKVKERTYHLEVLTRLSLELGFAPNYDEFFRIMMTPLQEVIEYDIAGSLVRSERGFNLYFKSRRPISEQVKAYISKRLTTAYIMLDAKTYSQLKTKDINLVYLTGKDPDAPVLDSLGSSFQVPLIVGTDKIVTGILFVGTEKEQFYSQENIKTLYSVANQATAAIQRLNERLQEEKSRLIGIIENLPHGIIILDEQDRIIMMNSVAVNPLIHVSEARQGDILTHLGGRRLSDFLNSSPDKEWTDEIRIDKPAPKVFEVIGRRLNSGPFTGGLLLALRDTTEEALITGRVQQQERLAAVGQLAAGIAHDFNNLLTSIGGYSEMIASDVQVGPDVRKRAEVIRTQVRRAAQLIRQILDFSRKSLSTRYPLELISFMKESQKLLERTIRETVKIEMQYQPGEYVILADPVGLQQVVTNLAINAQDAMPGGGILSINLSRISLRPQDLKPLPEMPAGEYVQMAVSDTGEGMSPEVADKVFDPFFTTKPMGKGTGLGLSQAMGIIHAHDGFIDVESHQNVGTIFRIFLPVVTSDETACQKTDSLAIERGRKETILLVEDEEVVRDMGKHMLEKIGYEVIIAKDGFEALRLFNENLEKVALVITDLVMPNMGGKELIKKIKSNAASLPVIVWTGYPLDDEDEALHQDIFDWIMKPPDIPQLTHMIRRAIQSFRKMGV